MQGAESCTGAGYIEASTAGEPLDRDHGTFVDALTHKSGRLPTTPLPLRTSRKRLLLRSALTSTGHPPWASTTPG